MDPELEALIRDRFGSSQFARWMGISLVSIGDGASELRLDLQPHHLNPGGIVHGGVIATLLDACIGLALRTKLGMDLNHVTIELGIHYLAPARAGALIGRGRAVRTGDRVSFGEAELTSEKGRVLAKGSATFLIVRGRGGIVAPPNPSS
jgi:acyl-CoA thioesterase